jgi:hypothetical protein
MMQHFLENNNPESSEDKEYEVESSAKVSDEFVCKCSPIKVTRKTAPDQAIESLLRSTTTTIEDLPDLVRATIAECSPDLPRVFRGMDQTSTIFDRRFV